MIDPRDVALQASCRVLAVPIYGALPAMAMGQRLLAAANGIFLQVRTCWLDCVFPIADVRIALPYGEIRPSIHCAFGKVPCALLREFVAWARAALPDEVAGGMVYSPTGGGLRLARYESRWHSPDGVGYRFPPMMSDEVVAIDLHSHGAHPAYFSPTDDADDIGIKIAGVFGDLDKPEPSCRFRLVVGRARLELSGPKLIF